MKSSTLPAARALKSPDGIRLNMPYTVRRFIGQSWGSSLDGWFSRATLATLSVLLLSNYLLYAGEAPLPNASTPNVSSPAPSQQGVDSAVANKLAEALQGQAGAKPGAPSEASVQPTAVKPAVEAGLSAIEQLLSGQVSDVVSTKLSQFGYDVFSGSVSTFAPVTNVPVGPDYVVGPGDSFTLTLWGRVNAQYPVTIDTTGEIILPELGVLGVAGMTFGKLEDYLTHQFSRKNTDFKMAITMGRLRTIRVYVVGEAGAPSSYTLSSLSTIINAVFAAGGPSKNGTLRNIRLVRNGQEPITLDLYDFLLAGNKAKDVRLQDGDTVFIPLIGPVVGVAGNVKRPAIYEMAKPMTLAEVLDLAGGVTYAGWLQRIQLERVENHQRRIVADFDISGDGAGVRERQDAAKIPVKDGDVVKVFPVVGAEQNIINLAGHVVRPGKYELKPGMRLRDILNSYEVFQGQPNLEYGEVERLVEPDWHPIIIPFNVSKVLDGGESENIELSRFDTIRIFRWDERIKRSVSISGMVFKTGDYRLIPGMKVSDLVDVAGGLMKNAYLKTAELTRRHIGQSGMKTETIDIDLEKAMAGDPEHNTALQDYDHLIVRPIPEVEFDRVAIVSGEVMFPGTYPVQRGETLSSVVERAGGYTERAYLKGAVFTRESAKAVQQERMDRLIKQLEESLLTKTEQAVSGGVADAETAKGQQMALEAKKELIARLRTARIDGRVVMRLAPLEQFRGSKFDLQLEKGDKLVIPETPGVVLVVGEVFNPTALLYEKGRTVRYYLGKVGGLTKEADKKELSVIRADGSVVSMAQRSAGDISWDAESHQWYFGGFQNITLDPGDTIVVPRKMDRFLWLKTTKDITQILFQMALTAGVVLAL